MRLNIEDIPEDGLQEECDLRIFLDEKEKPVVVHSILKIDKIGCRILIHGTAGAELYLKCSRCLNEFTYPVDTTFHEEYVPIENNDETEKLETGHRDLDLSFYRNNEIDFAEVMREQVLLTVPLKPLCSSSCRGMCPACGKDLNQGPCNCRREGVDPRLAPLQKLRERMNKGKE